MATVTIPDNAVVETFTVTTADDSFNFSFTFFDDADILVYKDGVLEVGYTVVGTAGTDGGYAGGTVTLAATVENCTVVVSRTVARARTENFPDTGGLSIAGLNKAFNKTVAWVQELQSNIDRKLGFAANNEDAPAATTANAAARANKLLGFDASGDVQLQAAADVELTVVSAFMSTVLDDSTAAAARTTLGVAIGSDVQAYDADILKADTEDTLTVNMAQTLQTDTSSSGVVTCDFAGGACSITLSENITDINFTNMVTNAWHLLRIKQHASGAYTVTGYDTNVDFAAQTEPVISTGASAVDLFGLYYDGTDVYMCPIETDLR